MPHRLIVAEGNGTENFGPLTHFRAAFELVCGILPLWRKCAMQYDQPDVGLLCRPALAGAVRRRAGGVPVNEWGDGPSSALVLDGRLIADAHLPARIPLTGTDDVVFTHDGEPIGARLSARAQRALARVPAPQLLAEAADRFPREKIEGVQVARWPWDLVHHNAMELADDFALLRSTETEALHEGTIEAGAWIECPQRVHVGIGARVYAGAVLDASNGPIYVADRATIMPGAVVIGPAAVGEGSALRIHAKIYAGTTIGPVCKIGGEVEDSIVHGFSNKQHDGFLGHAYLGEWNNIGAGSDNSDLKNNYGHVRVTIAGREVDTGERFIGLFMGDHSKCGIGTTFNTGTVVGSCCNLFGPGLPPKSIPSFSWGGAGGFVPYDVDRCLDVARVVMQRRDVTLDSETEQLIRALYRATEGEREAAGIRSAAGSIA